MEIKDIETKMHREEVLLALYSLVSLIAFSNQRDVLGYIFAGFALSCLVTTMFNGIKLFKLGMKRKA